MPELGEIKIEGKYRKYIWAICIDCKEGRWVRYEKCNPVSIRCRRCASLNNPCKGKNHGMYKGGRCITNFGYVDILVSPSDFFYHMADKHNYVKEHRLVMAKSLGRCLESWEQVHHKNGDKQDNRIENLELTTNGAHHIAHNKGYRDGYTKGLTGGRLKQIKLWQERITLLESENADLRKAVNREV